jgi:hypothetical protein
VMGDGFDGKCVGNMYPTSLKHEAFPTGRRAPHNAEGSLTVGQSFELAVPFDRGQRGLRQGRSEKPRPTPEKSPQMRTDTGNTCALYWRNIATISEKQRKFLSCPDWLAEDPVCSEPVSAGNSLYQGNLQGKWSTRGCIRLRVLGKDPSHGHFDDSLEFHACLRTGN